MLKLLRIEWNKLWPSKTFRVLISIYSGLFLLFLLILLKVQSLKEFDNIASNYYNPFQFPDAFIIISILAHKFLALLPAIIVIVLVANEFNFKTARQHIIDGLSRFEFVLCKFLNALTVTVIVTIVIFFFSFIIGKAASSTAVGASFGESFLFIIAFFFRTLGYLSLAMFMAILIKRTGLTILLFFIIHLGVFPSIIRLWIDPSVGNLLPIAVFNRTVQFNASFSDTLSKLFGGKGFQNGAVDVVHVADISHFILVAVYIVGFIGLSYLVLKSRDLKA